MREHRQHDRRAVTLVIEYDGPDDLAEDYTANLSLGGTFVYTERPLTIGTPINLVLSFPGLLNPLAIRGVVRWNSSGDDSGVGIEFVDHDDSTREKLQQLIDSIAEGDESVVATDDAFRVLLVEDNAHLAKLVCQGLIQLSRSATQSQVAVHIAGDGHQALEQLNTRSFDALIVDLNAPGVSGREIIRVVRDSDETADLPIIATALGDDDAQRVAKESGSNIYIAKPFRLRQLVAAMTQVIEDFSL